MSRNKRTYLIPYVCIFACIFYSISGSAQSCVQPPPGMVGWWPGDGNAIDIIGNNNGSLNGGATFRAGHVGQAFDLLVVDDTVPLPFRDFVRIPADSSLEFSGNFSADFWVNMDTPEPCNFKGFLAQQDFPGRKGWIIVDNCKASKHVLFRTLAPPNSVRDAKFDRDLLVPGTWHHIAGVHEGTTNKIYLDGVLQDTVSGAEFQPNVGADIVSAGFDGRIDEIEIFSRALSSSEILAIYNAGSAGKCKDADDDGVVDNLDVCPDTEIPEGVPTKNLGVNRWALVDDDGIFDTVPPKGGGLGPQLAYTIEETAGCSCEQIITTFDLGKGHEKFGCSISAMEDFVELVNP